MCGVFTWSRALLLDSGGMCTGLRQSSVCYRVWHSFAGDPYGLSLHGPWFRARQIPYGSDPGTTACKAGRVFGFGGSVVRHAAQTFSTLYASLTRVCSGRLTTNTSE